MFTASFAFLSTDTNHKTKQMKINHDIAIFRRPMDKENKLVFFHMFSIDIERFKRKCRNYFNKLYLFCCPVFLSFFFCFKLIQRK